MMALREWIGEVTRRPLAPRFGPIGVEISKEKLHMVQLQQRGVEFLSSINGIFFLILAAFALTKAIV